MTFDRRMFIASAGASILPLRAFGQAEALLAPLPMDGGRWCSVPDFRKIVDDRNFAPKIVCGWRPERRLNDEPTVRLEGPASPAHPMLIHNYGHCGSGVTLGLGCASLAEKWVSRNPAVSKDSKIVIIGAGIIGLATAYIMKRRGYRNVTIRARAVSSGDFESPATVSDIAGGQFDAAGVTNISGNVLEDIDTPADRLSAVLSETLAVLTERRGKDADPFLVQGSDDLYIYTVVRNYTINPRNIPSSLMDASRIVQGNDVLLQSIKDHYGGNALPTGGARGVVAPFQDMQMMAPQDAPIMFGVRDTVLINTVNLISNLLRYLKSNADGPAVTIVSGPEATVRSFAELQSIASDVIFNCSGLGAAVIGGEDRHVTMLGRYGLLARIEKIEANYTRNAPRYLYSGFGYMFPRSDGTIIGGAWDGYSKRALTEKSFDQVAALNGKAKEAYFSSLFPQTGMDHDRARDMVRAIGYFFLGRTRDLEDIKRKDGLDWMSGAGQLGCAIDRGECG